MVDMGGEGRSIGAHGGALNILMGRAKDIRMMMVYGYARLVGYDPNLEFVSDILESFEVEDGKVFTFTLRKGHKWSDGAPFTPAAFRYYFEDVVKHTDLTPSPPPAAPPPVGHRSGPARRSPPAAPRRRRRGATAPGAVSPRPQR